MNELIQQLNHVTVRLEVVKTNGSISYGTAFFFSYSISDGNVDVMVTNRHVLENSIRATLRLSKYEGNNFIGVENVVWENINNNVIYHPDPSIDLCIVGMSELSNIAKEKLLKMIFLTEEYIFKSSDYIGIFDDVAMVGYPMGISDQINNRPIFRKGIIATDPNLNYNGKREFVVDISAIGGSSGSPMFNINIGSYSTNQGLSIGTRFKFIGIQYSTSVLTERGQIIKINMPTSQSEYAEYTNYSNLAYVINANVLLDFKKIIEQKLRVNNT